MKTIVRKKGRKKERKRERKKERKNERKKEGKNRENKTCASCARKRGIERVEIEKNGS